PGAISTWSRASLAWPTSGVATRILGEPSAESGDLLWEGQMLLVGAIQRGACTLRRLPGRQQAARLDGAALAAGPLRLDRVEPGALDGQLADDEAHAAALLFDAAIVVAHPGPYLPADVPAGVVPGQQQRGRAPR